MTVFENVKLTSSCPTSHKKIKIRLNTEMPIQVDGEPWIQSACEVNIIRSALKVSLKKGKNNVSLLNDYILTTGLSSFNQTQATMLRKIKMKRRNTEPSINQDLEKLEE